MHPVNKVNFGEEGMAVKFNDGTSVVDGFIVQQKSTNKFKVTDGGTTLIATLASTTSDASSLTAGLMTIVVNSNEHIARIYSKKCVTLEGNTYSWTIDESVNGSKIINSFEYITTGTISTIVENY